MTRRLLIVDDEQDIRDVIQASLEEFAGWEVVTTASGKEGLLILKAGHCDAILLDVSMPDMDGLSVFEQLQTDPETQKIPVALLTAKILPSDRRHFAKLNIAGVIDKPFNPVIVWRQIAEIFGWDV
ncbi:Histidine kinase [Tumidithrix helvetica PCC 7403]|uniref:response regulator n=1 Tax=Tumidithrix helvetica TaxID=3457545 RepID=UPI003CBB60BF